jgi:Inovirus Gp2
MLKQSNATDCLDRIQQFTLLCINSSHLPFSFNNNQLNESHSKLAGYITLFYPYRQLHNSTVTYSIEVQLFFDCCADLAFCIDELNCNRIAPEQAMQFNELVSYMRKCYVHPTYKKLINARLEQTEAQKIAYKRYVSDLFRDYSKLLTLRIDLGYRSGASTIDQIQTDRDLFFQHRRSNSLFDHMVGYIWVMEYGQGRGAHLHLILFFNGQKVLKDEFYAIRICGYWKRIVGPSGWAHTSNLDKKKLQREGRCGVGLIDHRDEDMIRNLHGVIDYLFKLEQHLPYRPTKKFRTIGRGELSECNGKVRGRPRSN